MTRPTTAISIMLGALALHACASEKQIKATALKKIAADQFRDPDSTQFRNLKISSLNLLCGEINAKNAFGAYVGFTKFIGNGPGAFLFEDQVARLNPTGAKSRTKTLSDVVTEGFARDYSDCQANGEAVD